MTATTKPQTLLPGQHSAPAGPVDLNSMYVMHHAFRRDVAAFRVAAARAPSGDRERWTALADRWRFFATTLHHHHAAEDSGLWPLLLDRAAAAGDDDARGVLEAMAAEHARIDPLLDECTGGFARLAADGAEAVRTALRRSLDDTWQVLDGHLGHEERDAMTILQQYLTDADWRQVERDHFRQAYSLREILFVVPWSQVGLPADIRRAALRAGGPPFALLWQLTRHSFARREAAAFGPPPVRQPRLGQAHTTEGPLDLSAIYVIHHGLRRDLRDVALAVAATPLQDTEAWAALAERWQRFATTMHHHQRVEDHSIWPPLLDRVETARDTAARQTLAAMESEHALNLALVQTCADGFRSMLVRPGAPTRDRLAADVTRTRRQVLDHLAAEESDALPLAQQYLTVAEWKEAENAARKEYGIKDLRFTVPWSALEIPAEQFGLAFAHGGAIVRALLAVTRRHFEREHRTAFRHLPDARSDSGA